ncbi:SURF1 family protein [Dokdonella sp.]|uniref:SURF1 family protein n=1 Tax=Dokdonella sp. TaxID=2291710 RepID=UPI003C6548BF
MNRRWKKPSWLAIALLGAGLLFFCRLGFWQLDRAAEKEQLLAAYASAAAGSAMTLTQAREQVDSGGFPRVRAEGRYDAAHTYLLDDQIRNGQQGRLAFALFDPDDGGLPLLVNRGFLAHQGDGSMPVVPRLPEGRVTLEGLYATAPGSGFRMGGNSLPKQASWPKLSIYIDTVEIGEDLGRQIDSRVLLLDADEDSGFLREWTPQIIPPEKHLGYAFQWFCFALAALVIFIVLHWRRPKKES